MLKIALIAGIAIATSLTFPADNADAFGGRGYARRQARRARWAPAPVVVHRTYTTPVVRYYNAPVVTYGAPVYHQPAVSVGVSHYNYGSGHYHSSYPTYSTGF